MEKFEVSLTAGDVIHHFEVKDYMHHDNDLCKYEVFQNGRFVASLEPDSHSELHICKDAGVVNRDLLFQLADELERYNI